MWGRSRNVLYTKKLIGLNMQNEPLLVAHFCEKNWEVLGSC